MFLLIVLGLVLLPGVVAALASPRFEPTRSLWPVRAVVVLAAAVGSGVLLLSLGRTWWVIEDWEREETLVTRGTAPFAVIIVLTGVVAAGGAVAAAWGHRNWAPAALTLAWLLLGIAAFSSTGEMVDSDASGEAGSGLTLGFRGLLVLTAAAVVASVGRLVERYRRGPDGRREGPTVFTGRDVGLAVAAAVLSLLGFVGLPAAAEVVLVVGLLLGVVVLVVVRATGRRRDRATPSARR